MEARDVLGTARSLLRPFERGRRVPVWDKGSSGSVIQRSQPLVLKDSDSGRKSCAPRTERSFICKGFYGFAVFAINDTVWRIRVARPPTLTCLL